jgi:hypothetical protein
VTEQAAGAAALPALALVGLRPYGTPTKQQKTHMRSVSPDDDVTELVAVAFRK